MARGMSVEETRRKFLVGLGRQCIRFGMEGPLVAHKGVGIPRGGWGVHRARDGISDSFEEPGEGKGELPGSRRDDGTGQRTAVEIMGDIGPPARSLVPLLIEATKEADPLMGDGGKGVSEC